MARLMSVTLTEAAVVERRSHDVTDLSRWCRMNINMKYTVRSRAGVCWITSEPVKCDRGYGEPLAAVVVMIARAVDLDGHDITPRVAGALRDALAAMGGEPR